MQTIVTTLGIICFIAAFITLIYVTIRTGDELDKAYNRHINLEQR